MVPALTLVESMFAPLAEQPPRRKSRGGWRQQLAAASTEPAPKKRKMSSMCTEHIRDWSEGISSGPRIWRHANAAVNDGKGDPGIVKLHACGNSERDQHIHTNIDSYSEISVVLASTWLQFSAVVSIHVFYRRLCSALSTGRTGRNLVLSWVRILSGACGFGSNSLSLLKARSINRCTRRLNIFLT